MNMRNKRKSPSGKKEFTDVGQKCYKCGLFREYFYFSKNKTRPSGHNTQCKSCAQKLRKAYWIKNKLKETAQNKLYRKQTSDRWRQYDQERYNSNLEYFSNKNRQWTKNNPLQRKELNRRNAIKRRTLKVGLQERWSVEGTKWLYKTFHSRCFKCNSRNDLTIDHLKPLSKGYSLSRQNAVLLCRSCNSSKQDKMPHQFFTQKELQILLSI